MRTHHIEKLISVVVLAAAAIGGLVAYWPVGL